MDLREIGWGGMDWIDLAQDKDRWKALMYTVELNILLFHFCHNTQCILENEKE
jgi:hypothetical protein